MKRLIAIVALMLVACSGPDTREEPETVIGTPPSPKDDPFFFVAMPAEAVPAATTGTIGSGDTDRDAAPQVEATETPQPAAQNRGAECFSCVRICPENVSDADCDDGYDTICGWGRGTDRTVASEIATGECNAALDLARSGSRYSRITGSCPAASCR